MKMKNQMTPEQVSSQLDDAMVNADQMRAGELGELNAVRTAKEAAITREQARLSERLGPTHPRVVQLTNRLKLNAVLKRDLQLEEARARTESPEVDENTWAVHGYVRDKDGKGVANLTVALFDQRGERLEIPGHPCTFGNGYFRLVLKNIKSREETAVFIRVFAPDGAVLYADKNALTIQSGGLDYREINLSGDSAVCVAVPEAPGVSTLVPDLDETQDLLPPRHTWILRGHVMDQEGSGLAGLIVSVYDKDLFFDDRLGQAETDVNGFYSFSYRTDDFRDLIEKKPDIFLKVTDQQGQTIYSSKRAIWYEAGKVETIDIVIGGRRKP